MAADESSRMMTSGAVRKLVAAIAHFGCACLVACGPTPRMRHLQAVTVRTLLLEMAFVAGGDAAGQVEATVLLLP